MGDFFLNDETYENNNTFIYIMPIPTNIWDQNEMAASLQNAFSTALSSMKKFEIKNSLTFSVVMIQLIIRQHWFKSRTGNMLFYTWTTDDPF